MPARKHEWGGRCPGLVAAAVLLGIALVGSGCLAGAAYTHTTVPIDLDMNATPRKPNVRGGSWKTLVIPLYVARPQFDWGTIGIADAARARGIETVYYADLETISVAGVWTQRWIHIYGE